MREGLEQRYSHALDARLRPVISSLLSFASSSSLLSISSFFSSLRRLFPKSRFESLFRSLFLVT